MNRWSGAPLFLAANRYLFHPDNPSGNCMARNMCCARCASATAMPRSCGGLREFALAFINLREIAVVFVKLRYFALFCIILRYFAYEFTTQVGDRTD